jgi:putative hydrolase of the HAD superfamily
MKALILDFGGVITRTLFETHAMTEAALGLKPGALTWRGPFNPSTDDLWVQMQRGDISERDYWTTRTQEVSALIGKDWATMQDFVQAARGADAEHVIRPEARDAIQRAHAHGIRLAILSNELDLFYGVAFRKKFPLIELFEVIVDATYTQILKPDRRAYQLCLSELGLNADQCVFVDDQMKNVDGALAVGIAAIHFEVTQPAQSFAAAFKLLGVLNA